VQSSPQKQNTSGPKVTSTVYSDEDSIITFEELKEAVEGKQVI